MPERIDPDGHEQCTYSGCAGGFRGEERDIRGHAHNAAGQAFHFGCFTKWEREMHQRGVAAAEVEDAVRRKRESREEIARIETEVAELIGTTWTDSEGDELAVHVVEPRDPLGRQVRGTIRRGDLTQDYSCTLDHFERVWRGSAPHRSTAGTSGHG